MEKENLKAQIPSDEELLKIADEVIDKYADALGELA